MVNHQVVGACAMFTTASPNGPTRLMYYRGAFVPPDVPQKEIDHHLSVGLIVPVDDPYNSPVDGNGADLLPPVLEAEVVAAGDGAQQSDETGSVKVTKRAPAKKAAAATVSDEADLADLRTRAVAAGMDPGEVEKASADDLRAALAGK